MGIFTGVLGDAGLNGVNEDIAVFLEIPVEIGWNPGHLRVIRGVIFTAPHNNEVIIMFNLS